MEKIIVNNLSCYYSSVYAMLNLSLFGHLGQIVLLKLKIYFFSKDTCFMSLQLVYFSIF